MLDRGQYEYETDMLKVGGCSVSNQCLGKDFTFTTRKKIKHHAVSLHRLRQKHKNKTCTTCFCYRYRKNCLWATIYEIWLHVPSVHSIHCRERTKIISKGLKIKHTLTGYFKWFISQVFMKGKLFFHVSTYQSSS